MSGKSLPSSLSLRRLLVSVHDVAPVFESEIDRLIERIGAACGPLPPALLVVPRHWASSPIVHGSAFAAKLRRWSDAGSEIFLHGWTHRDESVHAGRFDRWRAVRMTAGEGEFLGLSQEAARERMRAGCDLIEDITGKRVAGFIAPAWLYGDGAHAAMRELGFKLAEDHMRVWNPSSGAVHSKGPVITWATRSRLRLGLSLAAAGLLRRALAPTRTVRVAVHPGDARSPATCASIDATLRMLARSRQPARYADLAAASAPARAIAARRAASESA